MCCKLSIIEAAAVVALFRLLLLLFTIYTRSSLVRSLSLSLSTPPLVSSKCLYFRTPLQSRPVPELSLDRFKGWTFPPFPFSLHLTNFVHAQWSLHPLKYQWRIEGQFFFCQFQFHAKLKVPPFVRSFFPHFFFIIQQLERKDNFNKERIKKKESIFVNWFVERRRERTNWRQ